MKTTDLTHPSLCQSFYTGHVPLFRKACLWGLITSTLSVAPHFKAHSNQKAFLSTQKNCHQVFSTTSKSLKSKILFLKTYTGSSRAYYYLMHDTHQLQKLKSISLKQLQKNLHWIEDFINSTPGRKDKGRLITSEFLNHGLLNHHVFLITSKELSRLSHSIKAHTKKQNLQTQIKLREQFISHILMGNSPLSHTGHKPLFEKKARLKGKAPLKTFVPKQKVHL